MSQNVSAAVRTVIRQVLRTIVRVTSSPGGQLTVVADGFLRLDGGSYLTDGWCVNDEVTGLGMVDAANMLPRQVLAVTDTKITVRPGATPLVPGLNKVGQLRALLPMAAALERRTFVPEVAAPDRPFWREKLLPAGATPMTIGPRKRIENRGIYQIDLLYPSDYGTGAQDAMVTAVVEALYPGLLLTANGLNVNIVSATPAQALPDSDRSAVPISIGYKVFTITSQ